MKSVMKETPYGKIEIKGDKIISFTPNVLGTLGKLILKLGDEVTSNGRIFAPAGTKGLIKEFREPGNGCTNNVIGVQWHNTKNRVPDWMKTKDLDLSSFFSKITN